MAITQFPRSIVGHRTTHRKKKNNEVNIHTDWSGTAVMLLEHINLRGGKENLTLTKDGTFLMFPPGNTGAYSVEGKTIIINCSLRIIC